jgi:hypothetical protein
MTNTEPYVLDIEAPPAAAKKEETLFGQDFAGVGLKKDDKNKDGTTSDSSSSNKTINAGKGTPLRNLDRNVQDVRDRPRRVATPEEKRDCRICCGLLTAVL